MNYKATLDTLFMTTSENLTASRIDRDILYIAYPYIIIAFATFRFTVTITRLAKRNRNYLSKYPATSNKRLLRIIPAYLKKGNRESGE